MALKQTKKPVAKGKCNTCTAEFETDNLRDLKFSEVLGWHLINCPNCIKGVVEFKIK